MILLGNFANGNLGRLPSFDSCRTIEMIRFGLLQQHAGLPGQSGNCPGRPQLRK